MQPRRVAQPPILPETSIKCQPGLIKLGGRPLALQALDGSRKEAMRPGNAPHSADRGNLLAASSSVQPLPFAG